MYHPGSLFSCIAEIMKPVLSRLLMALALIVLAAPTAAAMAPLVLAMDDKSVAITGSADTVVAREASYRPCQKQGGKAALTCSLHHMVLSQSTPDLNWPQAPSWSLPGNATAGERRFFIELPPPRLS